MKILFLGKKIHNSFGRTIGKYEEKILTLETNGSKLLMTSNTWMVRSDWWCFNWNTSVTKDSVASEVEMAHPASAVVFQYCTARHYFLCV